MYKTIPELDKFYNYSVTDENNLVNSSCFWCQICKKYFIWFLESPRASY